MSLDGDDELEGYAECENCGDTFYRGSDAWKTLCLPCWKSTRAPRHRQHHRDLEQAIPDEMLTRLIRLCHPDRHGNSEAAHKATVWLLSLRKH